LAELLRRKRRDVTFQQPDSGAITLNR
jgi:hypothetical protein